MFRDVIFNEVVEKNEKLSRPVLPKEVTDEEYEYVTLPKEYGEKEDGTVYVVRYATYKVKKRKF